MAASEIGKRMGTPTKQDPIVKEKGRQLELLRPLPGWVGLAGIEPAITRCLDLAAPCDSVRIACEPVDRERRAFAQAGIAFFVAAGSCMHAGPHRGGQLNGCDADAGHTVAKASGGRQQAAGRLNVRRSGGPSDRTALAMRWAR